MSEEIEILTPVSCVGCRKPLGLISAKHVGRIWCTEECANDFPVSRHEARDSLITEAVAHGINKDVLAKEFKITRQRIDQISGARLVGV